MERACDDIEDTLIPIYLLSNVHPDKASRDAAEPCLQKYTALQTEIFQDEKLFARVNAAPPMNPHQAKLKKDLLEGFEDSGVALPPAKRARAKEIFDKLETLRQEFDRAIRDDPRKVTFTPAEMAGMPESYLKGRKQDEKGNYVLGLDYPSFFPFIQNAKDGEARKRYYVAKYTQGGEENSSTASTRSSSCARSSRGSTACRRSPPTRCATRWSRTWRLSTSSSRA